MNSENATIKKAPAKKAEANANRKKRSVVIISALRACMIRKGYADTSITDVANEAGISVSHLLYYFTGKDEILVEVSRELHRRVLESVDMHREEAPEERIHLLVHNMFVGVSRDEVALLREIIGLAPHQPALQEETEKFAAAVSAHFYDLFEEGRRDAPVCPLKDSAAIAGALWIGLMIQSAFQTHLDENGVRRLFRKALLSLTNFENS